MNKPVTIHDIAAEAGVSPSTVSRFLSGNAQVSPEKAALVHAVIQKHNYRPNVIAQGLARGKSMSIGVLTQNIASEFYGEILAGIEQALYGTGYHPVFASGRRHQEEELATLEFLIKQRVEGLIIVGAEIPDQNLRQVAENIPLIAVGRSLKGLTTHTVQVENGEGAFRATRYLIELGHTRIVHITGKLSHPESTLRRDGYIRALQEAGLQVDSALIIEGNFQEQSGVFAVESLLTRAILFTAIFAANDQMAYGARLALYRRGIRVPEDVSLIGFDDQPHSVFTTPPLTTMRQPTLQMGIAAAEAVLALIKGREPVLPSFYPELVIRESVTVSRQAVTTAGHART